MDTMTLEYIKKLMGWCPNAKMLETQHSIHSKYFEASDQAKGRDAGSLPVLPTGWWNKRHNRALVISSGLTLFSVLGIGFLGIHPMDKGFIFGLTIGTIFNLLLCIWNWHFLNKIKNTGKKIKKNIVSPKWRVINLILSLVLLYLFFSQFNWGLILFFISAFCLIALFYYFNFDSTGLVVLLALSSSLGWEYIIAFLSGFCLTAFLYYLTDMYWEKRNGKIIIVYGRKMPGIYIVNT
jgi:Predicted membrane protein